jgi:ABC-type multidrug transport system ATPase subunit
MTVPPSPERARPAALASVPAPRDEAAVAARGVVRRFGDKVALNDVSLVVRPGEIHALLGPNGAGKTTLLRILSGLMAPSAGSVSVLGEPVGSGPRELRARVGLIPAGDRSFYLRISGLENLAFFARLHGLRRREAFAKSLEALERVGLSNAARVRVGVYSHGMQKRLSVARALLTEPPVLLVDEATHDLDPEGARRVRALIAEIAADTGAAVVWATQRLDEIRGFADTATVLRAGAARFAGTVAELMVHATPRRFLLQLAPNGTPPEAAVAALGEIAQVAPHGGGHYMLALESGVVLGDALLALERSRVRVLACRNERSEVEEAFFSLMDGASA